MTHIHTHTHILTLTYTHIHTLCRSDYHAHPLPKQQTGAPQYQPQHVPFEGISSYKVNIEQ